MGDHRYILVVDDYPGIRLLLSECLAACGYQVETASGGEEALRKVESRPPRLVLLDLKMPGLSGLSTFIAIKKMQPKLPVIIMTAYSEMAGRIAPPGHDFNHFLLSKPFDLNELYALIQNVLAD
ncbi:MAG: response regulator [Syntrophomonadaceae bacterium]|nr:response regulator [Syntrophomonadaceae bacterium]